MIVFNLKQSDAMNDRVDNNKVGRQHKVVVMDMFERMGVRIRSEDVSDIFRIRKKEADEAVKPVIVEFDSEYEKWTVLRNKADLIETEEYKSFLKEMYRSREERELRMLNVLKNKSERRVE